MGNRDLAAFLRVASETGLHRGEMFRAEWKDVDLRRGVLVVRISKAKRPWRRRGTGGAPFR